MPSSNTKMTETIALPIKGACTGSASNNKKLAGVQVFAVQSALTALVAVAGSAQPTAWVVSVVPSGATDRR